MIASLFLFASLVAALAPGRVAFADDTVKEPVRGDTAKLQAAIDRAVAAGGGRVTVAAGRHLVGQLDLRSNVELHLEKGAVLEGKVGLENYRVLTLPYSEGT